MYIKVVAAPMGPAPEMVRQQWVGVVLEADEGDPLGDINFLTGEGYEPRQCVLVKIKDALKVLEQTSPAAADWFREHVPPSMTHFSFGADEVKVIMNEGI